VAAVLLLLKRRGRKLAKQQIDPMQALAQLARDLRDYIYLGRREARRIAIETLERELKAAGYQGRINWSGILSENADLDDATGAGRGYLGIVWKRYEENRAHGLDEQESILTALKDSDRRLKVVAATSVLAAFAEERTEVQEQIAPEAGLIQVWNVSWCKGTCATCASLDGTWRPLGWQFPYGPPTLHPNCGCYIDLVPAS